MAKDRIEVTHSCGHKEEHLFTKSSALNKRDAKYAAQRICSACSDKKEQDYFDELSARARANFPGLQKLSGASEKKTEYAERRRDMALDQMVASRDSVFQRLDREVERGDITEEMATQAKTVINNAWRVAHADFWLDIFLGDEAGLHHVALVLATILHQWDDEGWDGIGSESNLEKAAKVQRGYYRSWFLKRVESWKHEVDSMGLAVLKG